MSVPNDEPLRVAIGERLVVVFFGCVLILLAAALVFGGTRSIRREQLEVHWRTIRAIGPFARAEEGTTIFRGWEAIRLGVGLDAAGVMLGTGGIAILLSSGSRRNSDGAVTRLGMAFACLSFTSLLVACGCFFPPWRLWCWAFYGTILLVSLIIGRRLRSGEDSRLARVIFPLLIGFGIAAGWFRPEITLGIGLGLFAAIGGWAHVALLVPVLRQRMEEGK